MQMTPLQAVGYLTYSNYRWNRVRSPHIKPEQWMLVYGLATVDMEARFLQESEETLMGLALQVAAEKQAAEMEIN
jgi:hypothetical protein